MIEFSYDQPTENHEPERCARCGYEVEFSPCGCCDGEGMTAPGQLYEEDPLWYDVDDVQPCHQCGGTGGWYDCPNSKDWCNSNPLEGREQIEHGLIEWKLREPIKALSTPPNTNPQAKKRG